MAAQNAARLFAHHEAVALARRGLAVLQTLLVCFPRRRAGLAAHTAWVARRATLLL
jgi:hypothetical protein